MAVVYNPLTGLFDIVRDEIVELGSLVHLPPTTIITTDNTQTVLQTFTLDANAAYLFTAEVLGEVADHTTVLGEILEVTVKRMSTGGAVIVGSETVVHDGKDAGASAWAVTFTVSGNDLRVSVTGANATTINWEADLNYLKF